MVKICLIDDDQNILASLSLALKAENFEVYECKKDKIIINVIIINPANCLTDSGNSFNLVK